MMTCTFTEWIQVVLWAYGLGFFTPLILFFIAMSLNRKKSRDKFEDNKEAFQAKHRPRPSDDI